VSQWAGRAERGADTYASHYSEYEIALEPMSGSEQARVLNKLHRVLNQFPGITYEANTFLIERVDETISGYTAPVVVNIFGNDLERLDRLAQQLTTVMRSMEGATAVQVRAPAAAPVIEIRVDWSHLARWGIRADAVTEAIQIAFEGAVVGRIFEGNRALELTVLLEPSRRRNPDDLRTLPLKTADGQVISLSEVADVRQVTGRYSILHRGGRRVQTVTCGVTERDLSSFFSELKRRALKEVDFSADSYPEFTGAAVEQARARDRLILHSVIAGLGVVVLIYIALGSLHNALLVLVNIPFSLVGGVLAALLSGGQLSVGSMVGFVTLFGITVRNSIMLVSHYRHLVEVEGMPWRTDTARRGAQERLTSILVTALVTALAMLPIAINSDNPGREIMGPMAIVIIGGLVSSTLLNLLILPTIMLWYGEFPEQTSGGPDRGAGGS
jgi:Cu/Ag efflux pump CusA